MKTDLNKLFEGFNDLNVVVIGDIMLDNYWWGDIERISPEAPVPVVSVRKKDCRLGGAANVALNCKALGAKVVLASVIGDDTDGHAFLDICKAEGIDASLVLHSESRPTTTKTRVLSRNQQVLRIDDEVTEDLDTKDEHRFIDLVMKYLQKYKPQVVIFEDYNKGVLKENVIHRIIDHCREIGIITAIDPKYYNFLSFRNATIFKPNLKEVNSGLKLETDGTDLQQLNSIHDRLKAELNHSVSFITLSEHGVYVASDQGIRQYPSHRRKIADVSGAGDTVIATASLVYAVSKDPFLMADIANIAGGLVCEEVGVVPVDKAKLLKETLVLIDSQH